MSQSKKGSVPFPRLSSNRSTDLNVLKKSITSKNDGTILLATVPSASDLLSLLYPTTPSPPLRLSSIVLTPRELPNLPDQVKTPDHRISTHHLSLPQCSHHLCNFPSVLGLSDRCLSMPSVWEPLEGKDLSALLTAGFSPECSPWLSVQSQRLVLCY